MCGHTTQHENNFSEERENKLKQEVQKLQQEHNRTKEQLTKTRQERNQAREGLDQARSELREVQQEHTQTQEQLTKVRQDLNQIQEQFTNAQQDLTQAQQELSQLRTEKEQWSQARNSIIEILMNAPGQAGRQYERGQSSRGDLRVNDALPTTLEGMQEQLERERRTQQESRTRELQLRERMERTTWEQMDLLEDDRLSLLLQQRIGNVLSDHRLREELFPDQQHKNRLRKTLRALLKEALDDHGRFGLEQRDIAFEFLSQIEEQMKAHNRPEEEFIQAMNDARHVANKKGLFR